MSRGGHARRGTSTSGSGKRRLADHLLVLGTALGLPALAEHSRSGRPLPQRDLRAARQAWKEAGCPWGRSTSRRRRLLGGKTEDLGGLTGRAPPAGDEGSCRCKSPVFRPKILRERPRGLAGSSFPEEPFRSTRAAPNPPGGRQRLNPFTFRGARGEVPLQVPRSARRTGLSRLHGPSDPLVESRGRLRPRQEESARRGGGRADGEAAGDLLVSQHIFSRHNT